MLGLDSHRSNTNQRINLKSNLNRFLSRSFTNWSYHRWYGRKLSTTMLSISKTVRSLILFLLLLFSLFFFFLKRKDKNLEIFVEKKIRQIFIREKKTAWLFARNRIRLRIRPESFRVNISFSLVDTVGNSHIRRCTATPAGTLEEPGE